MQINSVMIYSKDGELQRWDFQLGAVNIVTGSRRTGKTALLQIVEYCIGKGDCEIPQGVIRNFSAWYAVLLQFGDTQVFIARKNPLPGVGTSSEIFVEIGASVTIPVLERLQGTTNIEGLVATLGDLMGIKENLFTPPEGMTRNPLETNFKHCWPYLFQWQDEVASSSFLFHHEKENPFMPQTIKDTLPYLLGVVKDNRLAKQEELRRLRQEAARLKRRLDEDAWMRKESQARGKSLVAVAQELGIYTNDRIPEDQETLVRALKQIVAWSADSTDEASGLALNRLQDERTEMLSRYRDLTATLDAMTSFAGSQALFADEVSEQKSRLESVGLLKKAEDEVHCPLCDSEINNSIPTAHQVSEALNDMTSQLESVSRERARLDRMISERSAELSILRQQLRDKGSQIDAALEENALLLERRALEDRRSRAIGRISLYLESLDSEKDQVELASMLADYLERIKSLSEEMDDDQYDLEFSSIARLVSEPITRWSSGLDVEYAGVPYRFDPRRLTMVADTPSGPMTMNKMGGASNALGNHLLALFALHSWFATRNRPVPHFLMLDQISQVYYPADIQVNPKEDDRLKVRQLYEWLFTRIKEMKGEVQLIVVDHADIDEPWFQDAVVTKWRNGIGMIPDAWQIPAK